MADLAAKTMQQHTRDETLAYEALQLEPFINAMLPQEEVLQAEGAQPDWVSQGVQHCLGQHINEMQELLLPRAGRAFSSFQVSQALCAARIDNLRVHWPPALQDWQRAAVVCTENISTEQQLTEGQLSHFNNLFLRFQSDVQDFLTEQRAAEEQD